MSVLQMHGQTVSAASQAAVFRSSVSPNIVPKQVQTGIIYPGLSGTIWTAQLQPPLSKRESENESILSILKNIVDCC